MKATHEELLAALEAAEQETPEEDTVYTPGDIESGEDEISEAEQLAAAAPAPKTRKDGNVIGAAGWRKQRPLTASQLAFVRGVIEGKTYKQAYMDAYPNAQGAEASIRTAAHKLARDARIQKLITEAWDETQEALAEDMAAVKRYVMRRLVDMSKGAEMEGTRVKCIELLGKASGLFSGVNAPAKPMTAEQLKRELSGHLKLVNGAKAQGE